MSGFVEKKKKKKQRRFFVILILLIFTIILFFIFPTFENSNSEIIPNDTIMPDPYGDLTSLTSIIEELELSLFQKDQKIKFRDGQIKTLQKELKNIQLQHDSVILEINNIKNNSNDEGLISTNKYNLLQEKYTKLGIQNDKNILIINNLNQKIDEINNKTLLTNEEIESIILDNKKLTKNAKIFFAKNLKLNSIIKDLNNDINTLNIEINLQLDQIKKLKDKSHHGS